MHITAHYKNTKMTSNTKTVEISQLSPRDRAMPWVTGNHRESYFQWRFTETLCTGVYFQWMDSL